LNDCIAVILFYELYEIKKAHLAVSPVVQYG